MAVPPHKIMKPLLRFCRSVVSESDPVFVRVETQYTAKQNDCFENVRIYAGEHGGEMVHGWAIWEWPRVYFEAEFHCVWRSPDGRLVDITPNSPPYPWILFLPDPIRVYRNRLINNHRKKLVRDPVLDGFYEVCQRWHRERSPQFEDGFVETETWLSRMKALHHERLAWDRKMLTRFGGTLIPAIDHRLSCPMPATQ